MKLFKQFPKEKKKSIRFILTDIDDTLTYHGRLPSVVLSAMERLKDAGLHLVPITGRPAGWCDHMARMWPVDAVVGENGAFYFSYDDTRKKMRRRYWEPETRREADRQKLKRLKEKIVQKIPGCRVSADQAYRETDLAIDFCEDVPPLSMSEVRKIVRCFENAGARAKISSIHVNGWFGNYDKLSMTDRLFKDIFHTSLKEMRNRVIFIGDSPNDTPMFAYFPQSVGVANIMRFNATLSDAPAWMTEKEGGFGFAEMAETLLSG